MHSIYAFGAFCAPLVATQFSQLSRWSFHFLVSLGITIPNIITLAMVFNFKRQHGNVLLIELQKRTCSPRCRASYGDRTATIGSFRFSHEGYSQCLPTDDEAKSSPCINDIHVRVPWCWDHRRRYVMPGLKWSNTASNFQMSPPGWIVTYLIDTRGGGLSTGYVSSGLYGGMFAVAGVM